jgi:hypothetical protein
MPSIRSVILKSRYVTLVKTVMHTDMPTMHGKIPDRTLQGGGKVVANVVASVAQGIYFA